MGVTTTKTNKPFNPRGNDQSPLAYNKAAIYSGKALDFDGVNDLVSGSSSSLPVSDYTIAAWFNLDTLKASGVFTWGDEATSERRSLFVWDGGSGSYYLYSSTYGSNVRGNTPLSVGRWYFGAVTLTTGGEATIYLNGNQDGIGTNTLAAYTGTTYKIGDTGSSETFDGEISGTRVFNQVLTPAQIADLYNFPEKIVPTGVANTALKLWLPMQEGAGTTAYDGSGNGNHGTISGATYVNGVGAPVAQTAVINWNKGSNLVAYSDVLQGNWTLNGATWTSGQDDPIGGTKAYKITSTGSDPYLVQNATTGITVTQYTAKCWVKGAAGREARLWIIRDNINFESEDFTLTGDWQEIETTKTLPTTPINFVSFRLDIPNNAPGSGDVGYIFAPRLVAGDNADVYIPTFATAQTSPVLLPQGLTAGRDITGVNLFENVRKQGALNLDGSSFAEVHKNDSVPEGIEDRTMEVWVYHRPQTTFQSFIELGEMTTNKRFAILSQDSGSGGNIYIAGQGYDTNTGVSYNTNAWNHIAVTLESGTQKVYKNGVSISNLSRPLYNTASDTIEIGRHKQNSAEYSYSTIAQPRIYNRALTAEEVQRNYDAGKNIYTN